MPTQIPPVTEKLRNQPATGSQALTDTATFSVAATPATGTRIPDAVNPCRNCKSEEPWGESEWCPRCGFYPKLGMCIPVEALKSQQHHEEVLEESEIPAWIWGVGGGVVAILAVSIAARMKLPADGPTTLWTIAQVSLGGALLLASHFQAYVLSGSKNDKLGLFDMLAAPAAVWRGAFESLPKSGWLVARGSWGAAAILCGFLVVGGLGWSEINAMIAEKARQQEKFKPLAAISSLAQKGGRRAAGGGPENVEDAMNAFVNDLGVDDLQNGGLGPVIEESPGLRKQCAIVGYTRNVDGDLKSVVLASMAAGRPDEFVAKVPVTELPASVSSRLASVLPEMRTSEPSVECPMNALWVEPTLICTMAFEEGAEDGNWSEVKFVEMLNAAGIEFDEEQTAEVLGETQQLLKQSLPELQNALGGN